MKKFDLVTKERNKAVNHCLNLESKQAQLGLLIKQLQNLAGGNLNTPLSYLGNDYRDQLDYLTPANSVITKELNKAVQDQEKLSRDIKDLKDKIGILNKRIHL